MELAWSCSNLDLMVDAPVFSPWRKPPKAADDNDSVAVDDEIMVLVAVSCDAALRDMNEATLDPPIA